MAGVVTIGSTRPQAALAWGLAIAGSLAAALAVVFFPWNDAEYLPLAAIAAVGGLAAAFRRPRFLVLLGAATFIGGFVWIYVNWVAPFWGYSGIIDSGPDPLAQCAVALVALAPAAWLPLAITRPSDVLVWFVYLFGYVPSTVVPIFVLGPDLGTVVPFEIALAAGFAVVGVMHRAPRVTLLWPGLSEPGFMRLLGALGVATVVYIVAFFGIPTRLPDFVSVYDVRQTFGATAGSAPLSGYIVTWAGNVIYPFLIALGLTRRRPGLFALGVLGEVLIYSVGGFKAALFAVPLVIALCILISRRPRDFGVLLMWAAVSLLGVSIAATVISDSLWPLALGVVRMLALPGQLASYYFDYFSTHQTYELSRSILRWFIESPYEIEAPYLIGAIYLHAHVDANANLWADAMANFGVVGILSFSAVLGGILWVLDSVAAGRDLVVIAATLGLAGMSLANGALFTSILTFGVGLTIVLAALMPRTGPPTPSASPTAPSA